METRSLSDVFLIFHFFVLYTAHLCTGYIERLQVGDVQKFFFFFVGGRSEVKYYSCLPSEDNNVKIYRTFTSCMRIISASIVRRLKSPQQHLQRMVIWKCQRSSDLWKSCVQNVRLNFGEPGLSFIYSYIRVQSDILSIVNSIFLFNSSLFEFWYHEFLPLPKNRLWKF